MPEAEAMQPILHYPTYPGHSPQISPVFSERSVNLVMMPIFFYVEEHHRICHCPIDDDEPIDDDLPTGTRLDPSPQNSGCGVIPVPKPSVYPPEHLRWLIQPTFMFSRADVPAQNQNQSQHPQPIFGVHHPDSSGAASSNPHPASTAESSSLPGVGVISPSGSSTGAGGSGGGIASDPITYIPIDYSVSNAWFPGRGVPSLCFFKRKVERLVWEKDQQDREQRGSWMKKRMRDEIVFGVRGIAGAGEGPRLVQDWRKTDGKCRTCSANDVGKGQAPPSPPKGVYVYETYDPDRPSSHDPERCARCKQWEAVAERERRQANAVAEARGAAEGDDDDDDVVMSGSEEEEEEDVDMEDEEDGESMMSERDKEGIRQLEGAMRTYAYRSRAPPRNDGEGDADPDNEDMILEPIDAESMGLFHFHHHHHHQPSSPTQPQQVQILGDDEPKGQPGIYDPNTNTRIQGTRRVFDPTLVGAPERCAGGIRDVVLTGETGRKHVVWHRQKYRLFGRVRRWDGLVGFVRVDQGVWEQQGGLDLNVNPPAAEAAATAAAITNMIILGYVVGDQNFVGEWRMATTDPLRPGWGGPVVMCRREPQQKEGAGGVEFEPVGGEAVWV